MTSHFLLFRTHTHAAVWLHNEEVYTALANNCKRHFSAFKLIRAKCASYIYRGCCLWPWRVCVYFDTEQQVVQHEWIYTHFTAAHISRRRTQRRPPQPQPQSNGRQLILTTCCVRAACKNRAASRRDVFNGGRNFLRNYSRNCIGQLKIAALRG